MRFRTCISLSLSVARFLGMTTSSVNRMAKLEEMTELAAWDK
jgi:hypothetical protein